MIRRNQVLLLTCMSALAIACSKATPDSTTETGVSAESAKAKSAAAEPAIAPANTAAMAKEKTFPAANTDLADAPTYTVKAHVAATVKTGEKNTVTIHLMPKTGWKINQEFPTKLSVHGPAGITMTKATQAASDAAKFSEKTAVFEVEYSPTAAGTNEFTADFRFAMCTEATCDPKSAKLAWTQTVQ